MTLTKEEQRRFRKLLFLYQDGLAVTANIVALHKNGFFSFLETRNQSTLEEISTSFSSFHKGYLNIALRSLASQGYLHYEVLNAKTCIRITSKYSKLKEWIPVYTNFERLYKVHLDLLKIPFSQFLLNNSYFEFSNALKALKIKYPNHSFFLKEVVSHLEGMLLTPVLTYLTYHSENENIDSKKYIVKNDNLLRFFDDLGLISDRSYTKKGNFLMDKSYAFGVTTSYLPIMSNIETYLKGDFMPFFKRNEQGNEKHVFREINVWGSGGSHKTYFRKIDLILKEIFNKPLEDQPKGIIDVGCGNGALLEHMFHLIWNDTTRRKDLDKNRLILIGADYNKEALLSTQRNLKKADVWAEVVWGDIGNPRELDLKLQELYNIELSDLLNIRSFLDHNRPYNKPIEKVISNQISSGAFSDRGNWINNHDVEQSLVEHFCKWKPYIEKHGLLLIELHTLDPKTVSLNLGNTPCTAYDVTHGFSDQYIVEIDVFNNAVEKAGLKIDKKQYYKFPNSELSTVSINLIS